MRELIRKELREHFKVALLGLAIFAVMLALVYSHGANMLERMGFGSGYTGDQSLQPLLASDLLIQAAFFCSLFGTLLGWLQIRAEKHPDLWAFLIHRPIPRSTILQSKLLSGLLLYVVGAGLPALGLVLIVATPGRVAAPFEWAMALPLFAIFLLGTVFYLAGLLTGLRSVRWYGSRAFGLGPPLLAAVAVFGMPEFWHALIFIVMTQGMLMLAVWGAFRTGGHYIGQPVPSKLALLLSCTVSATVLLALLANGLTSLLWTSRTSTYSYYQITKNGTVLKITQRGMDESSIVDLNGAPVLDETTGRNIQVKDLVRHYGISMSARSNFTPDQDRGFEARGRYIDANRFYFPWSIVDKVIWYMTADGRLVAYHALTRRQVAVVVPPADPGEVESRFLPPPIHTYRALGTYETATAIPTARTAYLVDLEKSEMKPLFRVTNDNVITGLAQIASRLSPASSNVVLVLSRDSIHLLNFEGKMIFQLPFEPSPSEYSTVSLHVFEKGAGYGLRFDPDYAINHKLGGRLLTHFKWLNPDGTLRRALDLPKLQEAVNESFGDKCLTTLLPPVVPIYPFKTSEWPMHILRLVPALVCAVLGWWLCGRNNLRRGASVGWFIFHLFFGIPGLLGFLAVQEWPPKERCPSCRKLRVMRHVRCEHCGTPVLPPARTGIEIFEPLEAK